MLGSLNKASHAAVLVSFAIGCGAQPYPVFVSRVDRTVRGPSRFPVAVAPKRVGTYPALTKSGAGYF